MKKKGIKVLVALFVLAALGTLSAVGGIFFFGNQTHTVTFDPCGGDLISAMQVKQGATINVTPTWEGYAFQGWYLDQKYTKAFQPNTPIKSDITLYAKWPVNIDKLYRFELTTDQKSYAIKTYQGRNYNSNYDDTYLILPKSYHGKVVTTVKPEAFISSSCLQELLIPNGYTTIGNNAFASCDNLNSVTIASSVKTIDHSAFYNNYYYCCFYCEAVQQPSGWADDWNYNTRAYDDGNDNSEYLIWGCKVGGDLVYELNNDLASYQVVNCRGCFGTVVVPAVYQNKPVTSIGTAAFQLRQAITEVVLPDSITNIGSYAFSDCTNLKTINLPNGVTNLGNYVFFSCQSLESISIPASVQEINQCCFYDCISLTSIEIPSSVTSIGDGAFQGCTGLTNIEISSSVTSIGEQVFADCTSLTSIEIPNSVTSIGVRAFFMCEGLTSIEIPSSVTSIGRSAFYGCANLTIRCAANTRGWDEYWHGGCPVIYI